MIHLIYSSNNNWFEIKILIFVLEELFLLFDRKNFGSGGLIVSFIFCKNHFL